MLIVKLKISILIALIVTAVQLPAQDLKPTAIKALININVTDLADKPLSNELVIFVSQKDAKEYQVVTNENGKAQILLPKKQSYDLKYKDLIEKVNHSSFKVPGGVGKLSFDLTIKFEPSDMIVLKGLEFDKQGNLTNGANIELEMMLDVLKLNDKMEIQIVAHSDNADGPEKSLQKTQRQADTIKKFFVQNGIQKERIIAVGMGMSEPLGLNALPEGRERNNRIEIRIIKKYL